MLAQTILKRVADGDEAAVKECLDTYGGLVWSLARRMMRNNDDAEDAVQEIFLDIWKNAGRYDETLAKETTFIATIARRRLIDRLRRMNRRITADSLEDTVAEPVARDDRDIQRSVEARQAAEVLDHLNPSQQQALQLSIVYGLSHQEIADTTRIPLRTIKTNIRRGLLVARSLLGLGGEKEKEVSA